MRKIETANELKQSEDKETGLVLIQQYSLLIMALSQMFILHGNHIATYFHDKRKLQIFDGGWQSNTTKSRLKCTTRRI